MSEIEVRAANARIENPDLRAAQLEREAQALAAEIDGCVREMRQLGLEYRLPLDAGLVDFPGEIGGRRIFLCWRLGEEAVEHWHETDAGFAGRQPLEADEGEPGRASINPEQR